jgi:hypothetical protein
MLPSAVVTAVDACYALLGTERQWIEGLTSNLPLARPNPSL